MIPVFDGHNDAITREDAADFATGRDGGHLDLPRARAGGLAGGIFALFTPTPGAERIDFDAADGRPHGGRARRPDRPRDRRRDDDRRGRAAARASSATATLRIVRAIADLDAARAEGVLAVGHAPRGRRGDRPRARGARRSGTPPGLRSLGPVWSRAERVRPRRPVRLPRLARHRPRPDRGRPRRSCAAAPSSASRSTSATSTRPASGTSRELDRRAADRLALRRARAVRRRRATSPTRSSTRSPPRGGLVGIVFAVAVHPRRRRRRRRHAARDDRRPRPLRRRPHRGRARRRSAPTSTARRCPTRSATSPACRSSLDALAPPASPRTSSRAIAWDNWRRVLARRLGRVGPVPFDGVRTDPTDTGGLFVGRRPGTAPTRYAAPPERGGRAGGAWTRCSPTRCSRS